MTIVIYILSGIIAALLLALCISIQGHRYDMRSMTRNSQRLHKQLDAHDEGRRKEFRNYKDNLKALSTQLMETESKLDAAHSCLEMLLETTPPMNVTLDQEQARRLFT